MTIIVYDLTLGKTSSCIMEDRNNMELIAVAGAVAVLLFYFLVSLCNNRHNNNKQ